MLVLTRRANQSIMIGHDVIVTVLEVRGDQVRLGIKAPREVMVHREEVYAEIMRENREAVLRPSDAVDVPTLPVPPSASSAARPGRGSRTRPAEG